MCLRVFQARYESRGLTLSRLESDMGNKQEVRADFGFYEECKGQWMAAGCVETAVDWSVPTVLVTTEETMRVEVSQPVDRYRKLADYVLGRP